MRSWEEAGVPLDGMAAAVREGALSFSYLDASAFDRFAGTSGTTFQELSDGTGIPFDLLRVVREAVGFAEPRPEDHVRVDELSVVRAIELQLSMGFRPAVIEGWLRVCADGLRRIAETETDWWRTEVELPLLQGGMTEPEMLDAQAETGSRMTPLLEQALVGIYRMQQEHAWSKSAVEDVEGALERAGLYRRVHRPPAVSFLDISGYTRLTEERGDEAAADLAATLAGLVRRSSQGHGGQPVKWLGDGVMFYFPDPGESVIAALDMVEGVATHALPPARVGIQAGPVVFQEGDYFGRTVNVAAQDRRVRQTRRGAGDPGRRGRRRRNVDHVHGDRAGRAEGRVRHPSPPHGPSERLSSRGSPIVSRRSGSGRQMVYGKMPDRSAPRRPPSATGGGPGGHLRDRSARARTRRRR